MRPLSIRKAPSRVLSCALFAACLALAPAFVRPAIAQSASTLTPAERAHIGEVLSSLNRGAGVNIGEVAVSPDGKRLAWSQGGRGGGQILVAPIGDLAHTQPVTAATPDQRCFDGTFTWAPDSAAIAFLSDCGSASGQENLYLSHLDGGAAQRLTDLHGFVQEPAFAPDGKHIAFLYVEGATRPAGALAAQDLPSGVIGVAKTDIQRIAFVAADVTQPAAPTFATPANLHAFEFDWSPDSQSLAYIAADPPGENNWWVARLYTQRLGGPAQMVLDPTSIPGPLHGLQIAVPRWSPDGKAIAFIGGLMSDQGSTGGDVWIVSSAGGQPRDLTPGRLATPSWLTWDGSTHLYIDEIAGGGCRLVRLTLHGNPASSSVTATASRPIFSYPGSVGAGRLARSLSATAGRSLFVFAASTFDHPTEIYAARPGSEQGRNEQGSEQASSGAFPGLTQLSHFNEGVEPAWGKSVSLDWINDKFRVQGWLMLPKDYDPAKRYPLIVEVHGGPSAAVLGRWGAGGSLSPAAFSALGYFVLQPNPRGSFGQGEAFTQANRKDFGYGDLGDILAGVDAVEARYPIDPHRVGVTGWSYGGFMTMFSITQTHRFRAAVAGAGISDWLSYYGENSIDQWMIPFFGASVYDDPAVYARSSAINFIKNVKTPTLIVVGDRDGECPAPQSFEFWHALHDLGVPTEFVVYPNEGHGFVNPAHRRDVLERAAEWFARYMPAEPPGNSAAAASLGPESPGSKSSARR